MKMFLASLFLLVLLACQNGTAQEEQSGPVSGRVDRGQRLIQGPDQQPGVAPLIVRMGSATVGKGAVACLPVEVSNFKGLIGFQYTMAYDSAALVFKNVRDFGLSGYGPTNFGTRFADRGVVSTLWTDPGNLSGITKPENHRLYEICFENRLPAGQSATVKFQDGPTRIEVIGKGMQRLSLAYANGTVTSR